MRTRKVALHQESSPSVALDPNAADYKVFLRMCIDRFQEVTTTDQRLFTTDASKNNMWDMFLLAIPEQFRQTHDCRACLKFVEQYGALVSILDDYHMVPAIWPVLPVPGIYQAVVDTMWGSFGGTKVTGVFLHNSPVLGTPEDGCFSHISARQLPSHVFSSLTQTPFQAMAEKSEDFKNMTLALSEFKTQTIGEAVRVLKSDTLYRSEKVLEAAEWFHDLSFKYHKRLNKKIRENILWLAVASAPAGFCHPRSSMIGTLLEDIESGMSFDDVSNRFAAKMHPLQYQRPQAAPKAGTINQAEKLVVSMGVTRSLERRYLRPDEVVTVWAPKAPKIKPGEATGVFSGIVTRPKTPATRVHTSLKLPPINMTWARFRDSILPKADKIEFFVPENGNFVVLTTAVHADAPPILQWDYMNERNPVSLFLYTYGSPSTRYGLRSGWKEVDGLSLRPEHWGSRSYGNHHNGVVVLLPWARENHSGGYGLFPETLKSELHGIRSVVEAYSSSHKLADVVGNHAIGYLYSKSSDWNSFKLRVTTVDGVQEYELDRWE